MVISGFTLVVLVILGLALVTVFMGVKVVPQGREFGICRPHISRNCCSRQPRVPVYSWR
jgi:hypothetical protein